MRYRLGLPPRSATVFDFSTVLGDLGLSVVLAPMGGVGADRIHHLVNDSIKHTTLVVRKAASEARIEIAFELNRKAA